jgi:hypothetical protein
LRWLKRLKRCFALPFLAPAVVYIQRDMYVLTRRRWFRSTEALEQHFGAPPAVARLVGAPRPPAGPPAREPGAVNQHRPLEDGLTRENGQQNKDRGDDDCYEKQDPRDPGRCS